MVCTVYGLYDMLEFKLCFEILLLLSTVDMDQWRTGVNNAEYLVHLVCTNRLRAMERVCGVHIVGNLNGTRCRDGAKVLRCHSHLVWLVFIGFYRSNSGNEILRN